MNSFVEDYKLTKSELVCLKKESYLKFLQSIYVTKPTIH